MKKGDIEHRYRSWKFFDKVELIPREVQWRSYFDDKFANIEADIDTEGIKEAVERTIENVTPPTIERVMHEDIEPSISETIETIMENTIEPSISETIETIMEDTIEPSISETVESTISSMAEEVIVPSIEEVIDNSLDEKVEAINEHIDEAKHHLCCDISNAKNAINEHIDNKIESIGFEEEFLNLNEQVAEILRKLDNN